MDNSDTLFILRQLERGEISKQEADARLNAASTVGANEPDRGGADRPDWLVKDRVSRLLRRIWLYPLMAGVLIVGLGAWIITATVHANVLWFFCGLPVLLFGTLVVAVAASVQSAHWLYVNVDSGRRRTVQFGIPFPLGLVRVALFLVRLFGPLAKTNIRVRSRHLRFDAISEDAESVIQALERELAAGRGVTVDVADRGEHVQVYIV